MRQSAPGGRWFAGVAVLAGFFCLTACRRPPVFPRASVVLVCVDTLRADHLPVYGYSGLQTPNLDALAKDSVVFENAISHVPLTLPSHVSLFTGLLPFQHGVRDNLGYRLSHSKTTIAGFLRTQGYRTGAAVSAVVLDHGSGVASGFDFYEDGIESREVGEALGHVQRSGWETEKLLEDWVAGQRRGRPLFAFLHLYEPHAPYDPPEPFRSRYPSHPYDGEIAAADAIVGRFLSFLKERSLYDPSILVFLSDHGEGLGDHGEDQHGILLYRETIRVPLFLKLPGSRWAGRRVGAPAGLDDIFPTIVAAIGQKPLPSLPGVSLLDLARGPDRARRIYSETLYPRYHFGWSDLASLFDGRYHYIEAPRPELYDWDTDPREKGDLSGGLPPAFRSMRIELSGLERPLQAPGAADPETIQKLASLGYIGAARPEAGRKDLPDPKDHLSTIDRLKDASRLEAQHRDEEAISLLRSLAKENPLLLDAWEGLARILERSGHPREALEALAQADRLSPATSQILLGMANLNLELGDFARARALTETAAAAGATGVHEELSSIALAEGDLESARREARAALDAGRAARTPWLLLARAEQRGGNLEAALTNLDKALEIERLRNLPPISSLHATRGDVLARLGRSKEAGQEFRVEVGAFPENLDAWSRLALLQASAGDARGFQEVLKEMTTRIPTRRAFEAAARACEIVGDQDSARLWRERAAQHRRDGA